MNWVVLGTAPVTVDASKAHSQFGAVMALACGKVGLLSIEKGTIQCNTPTPLLLSNETPRKYSTEHARAHTQALYRNNIY